MALSSQAIANVKNRYRLSDIISRHVVLRPAGHEKVGLCPYHDEHSPSFRVNDAKGLFNCFGCGAGGDVIQFLCDIEGKTFAEAVKWLANVTDLTEVDPVQRERQQKLEIARSLEAIQHAKSQWAGSKRLEGTIGEIYLRSRGLEPPYPNFFRYGWVPAWYDKKTGKPGPKFRAIIAGCQNKVGEIVGVQRILLGADGNKAPMENPKLSLGSIRGCAIRINGCGPKILLCEGPEDGLTLHKRNPGVPVWIALGTSGLPYVDLPDEVEEVMVGGDNNAPGRMAVDRALENYTSQGRYASSFYPAERFEDFNDELRGICIND